MKPGAGPRHLAFHPGGRYAYLVNELDSTVAALTYDGAGRFEHLQTVRTLPDGFAGASTCADIQVSPSGTHVYASNRGHDSIVAFRVDAASGVLHCVGHAPTLGRTPRSFGLSPRGPRAGGCRGGRADARVRQVPGHDSGSGGWLSPNQAGSGLSEQPLEQSIAADSLVCGDVPRQLHAAMTSSRTKCRRMSVGAAPSSK